jgi:hypothetical protein
MIEEIGLRFNNDNKGEVVVPVVHVEWVEENSSQ